MQNEDSNQHQHDILNGQDENIVDEQSGNTVDIGDDSLVQKDVELVQEIEEETQNSKKWPCPCCTKTFVLKKFLKEHLGERHKDTNPWKCDRCSRHFADEKRKKKHACTVKVNSATSTSSVKCKAEVEVVELDDLSQEDVENEEQIQEKPQSVKPR
jgi:hypothetical protein